MNKNKFKVIYSRYYKEYIDEFDTLKEAEYFVEAQENAREIYAIKIIKPDKTEIDLKKEYEESMGLR